MSERDQRDRALGMDRPITRRDFVNGMAVAIGASVLPMWAWWPLQDGTYAPEWDPSYYPPGLTGLRGDHAGSFEVAHQMRDGGSAGSVIAAARATGEKYDLIVVGGGISGLAAAYFYQKTAGPSARILVLDNHDDFGGHAKRNEFQVGDHRLIGYGGAQSIDGPDNYPEVAKSLLADVGIQTRRFYTAFDQKFYSARGLGSGIFFDKETFGADHLSVGTGAKPWRQVLADAPLSEAVRRDIVRAYEGVHDYLPGLSRAQKRSRLASMSYRDYLLHVVGVVPEAMPYFQRMTADLWCVGIEAISALSVYEDGLFAGFLGMGLGEDPPAGTPVPATPADGEDPYIFHFPDGNASIARLLVRRLVPAALPGHTMDDSVTARVNYAALDDPAHRVRIRLNSTAVRVRHVGDPASAHEVEVVYVRGGQARSVRAPGVVLACWNSVSAYLCPELPAAQREAMLSGAKAPFIYTNVALRNWSAWDKLGIEFVYAPGSYYSLAQLDFPVSLGAYRFARSPADPIVVHMMRAPCQPGLPRRDQHRAGRAELLATPFETMERHTRDELARMLGPGGFDPARDIAAITVNRWAHGYAYEYDSLSDPPPPPGQLRPCVVARRRFGRITIANSDAAASAYAKTAIDQAHRAVKELVGAAQVRSAAG